MQNLRKDWGISFIYITHDLSTAYQITDKIIVMYAGSIMEMGPVDKVIENPLNPYVKTLINSIPIPDPDAKWRRRIDLPTTEENIQSPLTKGCKFYSRCPQRKEKCIKERPALLDIGGRLVACHLYH